MLNISRFMRPTVLFYGLLLAMLAACGAPAQPQVIRETVVATAPPVTELVVVTPTSDPDAPPTPAQATGAWTTPHPVLGDVGVRRAIAHCTNRLELIQAAYPFLQPEEQQNLLMDSFLPRGHWALATEGITTYPFDPEQGQQLLEEAGWELPEGETTRVNAEGQPLYLKFTAGDAPFNKTWGPVFIQQMEACGIQIIPSYVPGSWMFGSATGLQRRDFELAAFAWVGEPDPKGTTLYGCNQVPLPENNWEGQNYMGWCNETASRAIFAANNTLDREERIRQYGIFQREFTKDMVSLPLFNRFQAEAVTPRLQNFRSDPTQYYTGNIGEWQLSDGGDTVVLALSSEPSSLYFVAESYAGAGIIGNLLSSPAVTTYNYDYQADALTKLPTVENGGATNEVVEVKQGDTVWSTAGEAVELAPGVEVINAEGETVTYERGTLEMYQLTVTFEYTPGLTWEDGEPLKAADWELGERIACDPESGNVTYVLCESREVDVTSDSSYTITYLPGAQWPEYFAYTVAYPYPAHQVLSDGRKLADVPAKEWSTLPEVAERPLSYGPYRLVSWEKGQRMTFEANPHYVRGEPAIKRVVIQFIPDTNQAVAQLLTGDVDALGKDMLSAGPEIETVLKAGQEGTIQAYSIVSPTWGHLDMNLFEP